MLTKTNLPPKPITVEVTAEIIAEAKAKNEDPIYIALIPFVPKGDFYGYSEDTAYFYFSESPSYKIVRIGNGSNSPYAYDKLPESVVNFDGVTPFSFEFGATRERLIFERDKIREIGAKQKPLAGIPKTYGLVEKR